MLLQVVFHADLEREAGRFTLDDVADGVCKKLIYRHPHVFGDVTVSGTGEVLKNWEELKRKEKGQTTDSAALTAVARTLPALWRAEKVQKKAKKAGFDWPDVSGSVDKLAEEVSELRRALDGDGDPIEELGDVLFSAVNASRFLDADPEEVLTGATDKFISRFQRMEEAAAAQGKRLEELNAAQLDKLWEDAKKA